MSCTRQVAALAPDEIESGWSKHAHFSMPPVMHNSNVCAMLKEPLSQKELTGRDRNVPLELDSTTLVPAEMRLHSWLSRVCDPQDPSYDVWCGGAGPPARCQVHRCACGGCLTRLHVGLVAVCDDHIWERCIGVKAAALSTGFCAGCLAPVEAMEA